MNYQPPKGLHAELVRDISARKNEPAWMLEFRLRALATFERMPMPTWGADLSALDFEDLYYYLKPFAQQQHTWEDVPADIKDTFDALGILKAEQKYLAGVGAQYESEMIYKQLRKKYHDQGIIFLDTGTALQEYPELFKRYFASVIPAHDNKFAALNSAVWSGGSFVYVPKGVRVDLPLQAYFRINAKSMGQFERTLIIADEGSFVHYVEGCSAPVYNKNALHSAVVELVALPGAHIRYTTIQNWSNDVYNLVTKRALAKRDACVEWIDGNFGSKVTMKYPAVVLQEPGASAQIISIALATGKQHLDAGAKVIHMAPQTRSHIISKSLCKEGGRASYRGLLKVLPNATQVTAKVQCDALLFDADSRTDTYPTIDVRAERVDIGHEATVSKIKEDQLYYLMSRGLSDAQARALIVAGFIDPFTQFLPMEYAVEINRLIAHEMEGSIG
jgi:Fe-S cluster assembly protein SufB